MFDAGLPDLLFYKGAQGIIDNLTGSGHLHVFLDLLFFLDVQRLVQTATIASLLSRGECLDTHVVIALDIGRFAHGRKKMISLGEVRC